MSSDRAGSAKQMDMYEPSWCSYDKRMITTMGIKNRESGTTSGNEADKRPNEWNQKGNKQTNRTWKDDGEFGMILWGAWCYGMGGRAWASVFLAWDGNVFDKDGHDVILISWWHGI